jgi:hypothetical protein
MTLECNPAQPTEQLYTIYCRAQRSLQDGHGPSFAVQMDLAEHRAPKMGDHLFLDGKLHQIESIKGALPSTVPWRNVEVIYSFDPPKWGPDPNHWFVDLPDVILVCVPVRVPNATSKFNR